ncbi:MAG: YbgC/FadM family acyl-CoA thioesterase [Legionella sp.]
MKQGSMYQHKVQIYAEDVDFMGIVYHANYLRYFERSRTELLRQNDLLLSDLIKDNVLFAIKELNIKYLLPARMDDLLTITTEIKETSACSICFAQHIVNQHGQLVSEAIVQVVCVNSNLKPIRLPNFK